MFNSIKKVFNKNAKKNPVVDIDEDVSKGGSVIYKHSEIKERTLFAEKDLSENILIREKFYDEKFGKYEIVYHELIPKHPHIDVYPFKRENSEMVLLVTGGASDEQMKVDPRDTRASKRVEFLFPIARELFDKKPEMYAEFLRWLASLPFDLNTYFGNGHTLPLGNPPEKPFPECTKEMNSVLFLESELLGLFPENYFDGLMIEGEKVRFITPIIITEKECEYKLDKGVKALIDKFMDDQLPPFYFGARESLV